MLLLLLLFLPLLLLRTLFLNDGKSQVRDVVDDGLDLMGRTFSFRWR